MKDKEKMDDSVYGTYKKTGAQDVEKERLITEITSNKENKSSLRSSIFNSLRRKKAKEKIKAPNISKDAEDHIYDVIDDSKINRGSMKERPRLLTPADEISNTIALHPELKNILNEISRHEIYSVIEQASHSFDSFETNSALLLKTSILVTLKNIASLKTLGENQDLLNLSLDSALRFSKYKLWDEFIKTNNEKNEQESEEGNYETIEGDYETIEGDYQVMKNRTGEEDKQKERDYMNVKELNYMDMNKGSYSFFLVNTPAGKENKEAQQEKPQIAPIVCLN